MFRSERKKVEGEGSEACDVSVSVSEEERKGRYRTDRCDITDAVGREG